MGTLTLRLNGKPLAARRIFHGGASFLDTDSHCGIVAAASSDTLSAFCSRRAMHFLRRTRPSPESEEHAAGVPTLPNARQECPETLVVHFGLRLDVHRGQLRALRYDMHTLLRAAATSWKSIGHKAQCRVSLRGEAHRRMCNIANASRCRRSV